MAIGGADKVLTQPKIKPRPDFTKQKLFFGLNLTKEERAFFNFIEKNRAGCDLFTSNPLYAFFKNWLRNSIECDLNSLCGEIKTEDRTRIIGVIAGQKEILAMLERVEQARKFYQEDKKNG